MSLETLKAISSAFGINEEWLLFGMGEMFVDGCGVSEADRENVGLRIREIREIRKKEKLTQESSIVQKRQKGRSESRGTES